MKYKGIRVDNGESVESHSVFEMPLLYRSRIHLYLNDGDEETDDTGFVEIKRNSFQIFFGKKDKNGKEIYTNDKVKYKGKVYEVRYFEEYGAFGLYDEKYNRPLGRSGSSTKYEPYFMNDYHTKQMEIL